METQLLKRVFTDGERKSIEVELKSCLLRITELMECDDAFGGYCTFSGRYSDDCIKVLPGVTAMISAEATQDGRVTPATRWNPKEVTILGGRGSITELSLWDENEECEIEPPAGLWEELERELNEMVKEG